MSFYVDKEQFKDRDFEKTLEFYTAKSTKENLIDLGGIDSQIKGTYDINISTATGYHSYLHDLEEKLKTAEDKVDTCKDAISDKVKAEREARRKLRRARKELWETSIGRGAHARKGVSDARESLKKAKENRISAIEAYKEQLAKVESVKSKIEEEKAKINSCLTSNQAIVADTRKQIELVSEIKTKLPLLESRIDSNALIRVGNRTLPAGTVLNQLKSFSDDLKVSLATPLKDDSPEIIMLHLLEENAIPDNSRQEYSDELSQSQTNIQNAYEAYITRNQGYNQYLNKSSRGDDDGR